MKDTISSVAEWHRRARPSPSARDAQVQLGCHLEEVAELFDGVDGTTPEARLAIDEATQALDKLARGLKAGTLEVGVYNRALFLDSLLDQIVTGVGAAYCVGLDAPLGLRMVDASNWSKFDPATGEPYRDANGKIAKGPAYRAPDLSELV